MHYINLVCLYIELSFPLSLSASLPTLPALIMISAIYFSLIDLGLCSSSAHRPISQ